jgi:hypothetical protein
MKIEKIELLFQFSLVTQVYCTVLISMKYSRLLLVAGSTGLLRKHLVAVERDFDLCDAKAKVNLSDSLRHKHVAPITVLLKDIRAHRKMVVRTVQVQNCQINKYRKSIRDGRKTVKRGAPASVEALTMETMIQMTRRVIQDLKDMIPDLTQPLVQRIHANLRKLQDRMLLFSTAVITSTSTATENEIEMCQCNSFGVSISCHACHQGAHEKCKCNCSN